MKTIKSTYYAFVFCILCPISILAQEVITPLFPLEREIKLRVKNKRIEDVLVKIENATNVYFSYNSSIVDIEKRITANFKNVPVKIILDSIFQDDNIKLKVIDKQIIIFKEDLDSDLLKEVISEKSSKESYPYSKISNKEEGLGNIADENGEFVFKMPVENTRDTISISYIGYKTITFPVIMLDSSDLMIDNATASTELLNFEIRNLNPKAIIEEAVTKISENYYDHPSILTANFKESIKRDKDRLVLVEADVDIYKTPYSYRFIEDHVKINSGKKQIPRRTVPGLRIKVEGGPVNILSKDIVKNRMDFINKDFFDYYNYKYIGETTISNRQAYVIAFDQKKSVSEALFKGKIFIDKETLAFISINFGLSPFGIEYARSLFIQYSPNGIQGFPVDAKYVVSYNLKNQKWFLESIISQNDFIIFKSSSSKPTFFTTTSLLDIKSIDSLNVYRFENSEILKKTDILSELIEKKENNWNKARIAEFQD